jgi:hypothetical protein
MHFDYRQSQGEMRFTLRGVRKVEPDFESKNNLIALKRIGSSYDANVDDAYMYDA